jgi:hypothetical protein
MSLVNEVKRVFASWPAFSEGQRQFELIEGDDRLVCELTALDSMACGFSHLTLESAALAGVSLERLKLAGDQLARRLTYLLEPIAVLEVDPLAAAVQLRSNPPSREPEAIRYYELLVERQGRLKLSRFSRAPGESRSLTTAQVTREVFCRLVADFSAAVA